MYQQIHFVYCKDNHLTASKIQQDLVGSGLNIDLISCDSTNFENGFAQQLAQKQGLIILLVSDNFLKSVVCMNGMMEVVQKYMAEQRLRVVIVPGQYKRENGEIYHISTSFDRVSNVIQYMNYWQDEYLDIRKRKRHIQLSEEAVYNEKLRVIRGISSEIGEFLRILRNTNYLNLQEFQAKKYMALFDMIGQGGLYLDFKNNKTVATPQPTNEVVTESTEDLEFVKKTTPSSNHTSKMDEVINEIERETSEENTIVPSVSPSASLDTLFDEDMDEVVTKKTPTTLNNTTVEDPLAKIDNVVAQSKSTVDLLDDDDNNILMDLEEDEDEDDLFLESDLDDETEAIIQATRQLIEANQIREGLALMKSELDSAPENTELRYVYATFLFQYANDYIGTSQQLEILLEKDQYNENAYYLLAELAEQHKDFLSAKNYFEKVAHLNPNFPNIYYRLGMVNLNHFDTEKRKAAAYFRQALKRNPNHVDANYQYAIILNEYIGKHWKAIKFFKRTLKLQPNHPFAYYDLAVIFHKLGDKLKAHQAYKKAIQINPELQTYANDRAFEYELLEEEEPENTGLQPVAVTADESYTSLQKDIKRLEKLIDKDEKETPIETTVNAVNALEDTDASDKMIAELGLLEDEVKEEDIQLKEKPVEQVIVQPKVVAKAPLKTVFITGATSGIGRATADLFAKEGYRLILAGRRMERLELLKGQYEDDFQSDVHLLNFDVRNYEEVQNAIDSLSDAWGEIDVLVNNAGLAKGFAPIHEGNLEHWETMIDTNLKGLLYMTRLIAPKMVARRKGHIINVGSIAGKEPYPNGNVYNASKFAVDGLTRAMRMDLHQYNIRVSQVAPGHVEETEFAVVRFDGDAERAKIYEDFQPLKSSDIADIIYFMASRPPHVNVQDVVVYATQQASATILDRSGR